MNIFKLFSLSLALCLFSACHNHEHEDEHGHQHGSVADVHEHAGEAHKSDEIVLSPEKAERFGVKTSVIELADFATVIKVAGEIGQAPTDLHIISASNAGVVNFAPSFAQGKKISQGQAVCTISARSMTGGDPNESARIAYEKAACEYERILPLYNDKIVSERDFNEVKEAYEQARNAYTPQAGSTSSSATGIVAEVFVQNGQYVEAGTPIASVAKNQDLILRADLPERLASKIPTIRSANFKPAYSDTTLSIDSLNGYISSSLSSSQVATGGYVPVYFRFKNNGGVIANSFADIYLLGETKHNAIAIPLDALTEEQGDYFVYEKLDEDCYRKHLVKPGDSNGYDIEILSGVTPGMEIVTTGAVIVKMAANAGAVPGHSHQH